MGKPFSPKLPPINPIPPSERGIKSKWEKEFEDELSFDSLDYFGVENEELGRLVMNFIGEWDTKVKIKCKDGCIQIERIK